MTDKIVIYDISDIDYKKVCEQYDGEIIKLVAPEKKTPKFAINEMVETIEDYEDIDCPPEHGTVTTDDAGSPLL